MVPKQVTEVQYLAIGQYLLNCCENQGCDWGASSLGETWIHYHNLETKHQRVWSGNIQSPVNQEQAKWFFSWPPCRPYEGHLDSLNNATNRPSFASDKEVKESAHVRFSSKWKPFFSSQGIQRLVIIGLFILKIEETIWKNYYSALFLLLLDSF